jgi:hypothetical protein
MLRDLHNNIKVVRSISPVAIGTTGTGQAGKIIDRAGYEGVEFILSYGTISATGAVITPVFAEGDATGSMTTVSAANLLGTAANGGIPAAATRTSGVNKNVTKRVGYIGTKRYVQVSKLSSTVTAGTLVAADVLLARPHSAPVAT